MKCGLRTLLGAAAGALILVLAPSVGFAEPPPRQADGFNAPTLAGPWRFRLAINFLAPTDVTICVDGRCGSEDLGWVLNKLNYIFPIDGEVRKGSFGLFLHTYTFKISGGFDVGPGRVDWSDPASLIDVGLSYELGSWSLGESPRAPTVTVEPYVEARLLVNKIQLDLGRLDRSKITDFSNYVPVLGVRTFWEFGGHWNLELVGDYGGFGVDDNHQTWQAVGLIGYRWPVWGLHMNLQAGYRAERFFDLRRGGAQVTQDFMGPDIVLSVEF